jgi:membrane protease YdiL (CAAX protease family)
MTIVIALIVICFWSLYRLFVPENILFEDIVAKPIIWLLPVLLVTRFRDLGFIQQRFYKNIFFGLVVGTVFATSSVLTSGKQFSFSTTAVISALFTAIVEETFFRGYLLNRWLKTKFSSPLVMVANGGLFTLSHIPVAIFVYHYTGMGLLAYLVSNFVTGFVYVYLYYATRSTYTSISSHFVWNLFAGIFK